MTDEERASDVKTALDTFNKNAKTILCLRMRLERASTAISALLMNPGDDDAVSAELSRWHWGHRSQPGPSHSMRVSQ